MTSRSFEGTSRYSHNCFFLLNFSFSLWNDPKTRKHTDIPESEEEGLIMEKTQICRVAGDGEFESSKTYLDIVLYLGTI